MAAEQHNHSQPSSTTSEDRLSSIESMLSSLMQNIEEDQKEIWGRYEIKAYFGVSLTKADEYIALPSFPSPLDLPGNLLRWQRDSVKDWAKGRARPIRGARRR